MNARRRGSVECDAERHSTEGLEVGPRHNVVASTRLGLHGDGDTETGRAHGALRAEALHGLHEAPRGDRAELDLAGLEHAVAADDAPAVVERVDDCDAHHRRTLAWEAPHARGTHR